MSAVTKPLKLANGDWRIRAADGKGHALLSNGVLTSCRQEDAIVLLAADWSFSCKVKWKVFFVKASPTGSDSDEWSAVSDLGSWVYLPDDEDESGHPPIWLDHSDGMYPDEAVAVYHGFTLLVSAMKKAGVKMEWSEDEVGEATPSASGATPMSARNEEDVYLGDLRDLIDGKIRPTKMETGRLQDARWRLVEIGTVAQFPKVYKAIGRVLRSRGEPLRRPQEEK